ncbi:MAG: putative peptidoglycan glycosyltransferase FtsW, partial [Candidatus Paceibacterota bacterium]
MLRDWLDKKVGNPDMVLLGTTLSLLCLGLLILASVSASYSLKFGDDTYFFLKHQLTRGIIPGLILGYLAYRLDLNRIRKITPMLLLATFFLMALVFIPFLGMKEGDAARWIVLGPFSFQPSELLKLTFIFYLASWLAGRKNKENPVFGRIGVSQTFLAFGTMAAVIILLLFLQSNISTLGVIITIGFLMYFASGTSIKENLLILLTGAGGLLLLIKVAPYRVNRFLVFLNPDLDPMGMGYQLKQSLIAIGSGGIFGLGLGMSAQKAGFLPQTISDSIFAVFSEETGFVGAFFLLALLITFCWRGFLAAKQSKDPFFKLTAIGISSWIIVQSFVNIGAMMGLVPLTGIPLPFISYGGSS